MAQKRSVEVRRGQAGAGGSYCQQHFRFPRTDPVPILTELSWPTFPGAEGPCFQPVWKGQTGSSQQWAGVSTPRAWNAVPPTYTPARV